jgi:hypothetical protein
MGNISKSTLVKLRIWSIVVVAVAALLEAAVGFDFITQLFAKIAIFIVLAISIIFSLVINLIERLVEQENEAREVITRALDFASLMLNNGRKDFIRASVFLHNKGSSDKLEIRFHSSNMENAADIKLKFDRWQGCVGKAWGYQAGVVAVADQLAADKRQVWSLTEEQYALTQGLKYIVAQPVTNPDHKGQVIGILCFDASSDLSVFYTSEQVGVLVADLSGFIGRLLVTFNMKKPLTK